jgi:inhibitor of cysteine peptidase
MKRTALLILACLWGCSVASDHPAQVKQPAEAVPFPQELQMGPAKPVKVLRIPLGQTFKITLPSNPTTGYSWQLATAPDAAIVAKEGHEYRSNTPVRSGSGGHEIWIFKARGKGRTAISLQYVRPWEKGQPPADTSRFEIIVLGGE